MLQSTLHKAGKPPGGPQHTEIIEENGGSLRRHSIPKTKPQRQTHALTVNPDANP